MSAGERVFTYGTLMLPDVMRAVTGRDFASRPAVLVDYQRFRLRDRSYPGLVRAPAARTEGRVYDGVDAESLRLLDVFEGDAYERLTVRAQADGGSRLECFTYVIAPGFAELVSSEPWDPDGFAARHLADFLARCEEFRRSSLRDWSRP